MKNKYRMVCAFLAWVTLVGQYIVLVRSGDFGGFATSTLAYFGYFTILTNMLVALAFSVPLFKPESKLRRFFERQSVRAAIALYITVVAVVYYVALAAAHKPEGLSALFNVFLHLILPILYVLDWLVFAKKGSMPFKALPYWVVFPMAYGLFNIIRGAITGFYPYPFVNVTELGAGAVSLNMLGFTLFYAFGGAVLIGFGRVVSKSPEELQSKPQV